MRELDLTKALKRKQEKSSFDDLDLSSVKKKDDTELVTEDTTSVSEDGISEPPASPNGYQWNPEKELAEITEPVDAPPATDIQPSTGPTAEEIAERKVEDERQRKEADAYIEGTDLFLSSAQDREQFIRDGQDKGIKRVILEEKLQQADQLKIDEYAAETDVKERGAVEKMFPGVANQLDLLVGIRRGEGRSMMSEEHQAIADLVDKQFKIIQGKQTEPLTNEEINEIGRLSAEIAKLKEDATGNPKQLFDPITQNYVDKKKASPQAQALEQRTVEKEKVYTKKDRDDLIRIYNEAYLDFKALDNLMKQPASGGENFKELGSEKIPNTHELLIRASAPLPDWMLNKPLQDAVGKAERLQEQWLEAKSNFDAVNRALHLNEDPAGIDRGFVDWLKIVGEAAYEQATGNELETNRDFIKDFVSTVQKEGGEITEAQWKRFEDDLSDKVAQGLGTSLPLMVELGASLALMETGLGAIPGAVRVEKIMRGLMIAKYGKSGKFFYNLAKETAKGAASFGAAPSEEVSAVMGGAEGFTQGMMSKLNPENWLRRSRWGRFLAYGAKVGAGTMSETTAEFFGEYVDNLRKYSNDPDEAFKQTFGHDVESFTDKLLLTALISGGLSGTFNLKTLLVAQKEIDNLPDTKENKEAKDFVKEQREQGIAGEEFEEIVTADEVEGKSIKDLEVTPPAEPEAPVEPTEEVAEEKPQLTTEEEEVLSARQKEVEETEWGAFKKEQLNGDDEWQRESAKEFWEDPVGTVKGEVELHERLMNEKREKGEEITEWDIEYGEGRKKVLAELEVIYEKYDTELSKIKEQEKTVEEPVGKPDVKSEPIELEVEEKPTVEKTEEIIEPKLETSATPQPDMEGDLTTPEGIDVERQRELGKVRFLQNLKMMSEEAGHTGFKYKEIYKEAIKDPEGYLKREIKENTELAEASEKEGDIQYAETLRRWIREDKKKLEEVQKINAKYDKLQQGLENLTGKPDAVAEPVELRPETEIEKRTPQPGDQVTLPPRVKGGLDRTFEYEDGQWKQRIGDEISEVPEATQKKAQEQFDSQIKPKDTSQVKERINKTTLYHGTDRALMTGKEVRVPKHSGLLGEGIYFSSSEKEAATHGKKIETVNVVVSNPLDLNKLSERKESDLKELGIEFESEIERKEFFRDTDLDYTIPDSFYKLYDELQLYSNRDIEKGYDAVVFNDGKQTEVKVKSLDQIKPKEDAPKTEIVREESKSAEQVETKKQEGEPVGGVRVSDRPEAPQKEKEVIEPEKKAKKKERAYYTRSKEALGHFSKGLYNLIIGRDGTYETLTDVTRIRYANQMIALANTEPLLKSLMDEVKDEASSFWRGEDNKALRKTVAEKLRYKLMRAGRDAEADAMQQVVEIMGTEAGKTVSSFRDETAEGTVARLKSDLRKEKKEALKKQYGKKTGQERIDASEKEVKEVVKDVVDEMTKEGGVIDKTIARVKPKRKTASQKIRDARKKQKTAIEKLKKFSGLTSGGINPEFVEGVGELAAAIAEEGYYRAEDIVRKTVEALRKANVPHTKDDVEDIILGDINVAAQIERNVEAQAEGIVKKELPETINEIVKKHYTEKSDIRKSLAEKIADEAGVSEAEAKRIAKSVEKAFDNLMKERGDAAMDVLFAEKPEKQPRKRRELYEKVIEAINMGALTSEQYSDLFANHFGFTALSPEKTQQLLDFADKMQSEQSPEMLNRTILDFNDLLDEIKEDKPLSHKIIDLTMERYFVNMLSGMTTLARATIGATLSGAANYTKALMASPIATVYATKYMIDAGIKQWRSTVDIIQTGYSGFDFIDYKPKSRRFYDRLANTAFTDLFREMTNAKGDKVIVRIADGKEFKEKHKKQLKAAIKLSMKFEGMLPTYMHRVLLAVDAMFKYGFKEFETVVQQYNKELLSEGGMLVGNPKKVYDFYSNLNSRLIKINEDLALDDKAQAEIDVELEAEMKSRRDAKQELPFGFKQRRRQELVEERRDEAINNEAAKRSLKWILMGTPEGNLGYLYQGMNNWLNKETDSATTKIFQALGHAIFPFIRVGVNAVSLGLDFTLVGMGRGIRGLAFGTKTVDGKKVPKSAEQSFRQLAAGAVGTSAAVSLFNSLFDIEDDEYHLKKDPWLEVTATGTGDYYENLQLSKDYIPNSFRVRLSDAIPLSIRKRIGVKENGVWWTHRYSYVDNPALGYFLFPLGMMSDNIRYADPSKKETEEEKQHKYGVFTRVIANFIAGASLFATQQSYQQGIKDINTVLPTQSLATEEGVDKWIEKLQKMTIRRAAALTTPNLYKQLSKQMKALADIPQRDAKTIAQMYYKDQPLFETIMSGNIQTDELGYAIIPEFDFALFPDILLREVEKIIENRKTQPEWALIYKFPEVTLGGRTYIHKIDGYKLTPEERYQVEENRKIILRELIQELIEKDNKDVLNSPEKLQNKLNSLKKKASKIAKKNFAE